MELQPRQRRINNIHRPQVYVNIEFGVSWSPRHVPNNHAIAYRSRGLRDRTPNFPRQVPPPSTNYLETGIAVPFDSQHHEHNNPLQLHTRNLDLNQRNLADQNQQPEQSQYQYQYQYLDQCQDQDPYQDLHHQQQQQPQQQQAITTVDTNPTVVQGQGHTEINAQPAYTRRGGYSESPQEEPDEFRRPSRDSRSSSHHERGRSAPPPINDSPWDVQQPQFQMVPAHVPVPPAVGMGGPSFPVAHANAQSAVGPLGIVSGRSVSNGHPRLMKELPQPPTSYRLGEEGMPWEALSWPMGYEPEADPEHARMPSSYPGERRMRKATLPGEPTPIDMAANMTYVPYSPIANIQITSPEQETPHPHRVRTAPVVPMARHLENETPQSGRGRDGADLSTLSVAMMTVDNGFENQWWNQGPRETVTVPTTPAAGMANEEFFVSPESAIQRFQDLSAASLGWAVATPPQQQHLRRERDGERNRDGQAGQGFQGHQQYHSFSSSSIVSPMTPPPYATGLGRTLSTRSEEAYQTGVRYA